MFTGGTRYGLLSHGQLEGDRRRSGGMSEAFGAPTGPYAKARVGRWGGSFLIPGNHLPSPELVPLYICWLFFGVPSVFH